MRTVLCLSFVVLSIVAPACALAGSIASIKTGKHFGQVISAEGLISADFTASPVDPCYYISDTDGTRTGIKLIAVAMEGVYFGFGSDGVSNGLLVWEDPAGEKELLVLGNPLVFGVVHDPQAPYAMANRWVGGGPFHWDPSKGLGQGGPVGGKGLNNVGMLIRTSGKVVCRDDLRKFFYIDDGSNHFDACCNGRGIAVTYRDFADITGFTIPEEGDTVTVTGISSLRRCSNGGVHSLIRLRRASDCTIESLRPPTPDP